MLLPLLPHIPPNSIEPKNKSPLDIDDPAPADPVYPGLADPVNPVVPIADTPTH
jgi:hypothetical protein